MAILEHERICLDTCVLIGYLKNRLPEAAAVEKAIKESVCDVTTMTVYELLFGVARSGKAIGEDALLGLMTVLPMTTSTPGCLDSIKENAI